MAPVDISAVSSDSISPLAAITNSESFVTACARLKKVLGPCLRSRISCGEILAEFHDVAPKSKRCEAVESLAKAVGISRWSAFDFIRLFRDSKNIGVELLITAAESGINTDIPQQMKLLWEAKSNFASSSHETIIEKAKAKIEAAKKRKRNPPQKPDSVEECAAAAQPEARKADWTRSERINTAVQFVVSVFKQLTEEDRASEIKEVCDRLRDEIEFDRPASASPQSSGLEVN
jgi:hypothetical protein